MLFSAIAATLGFIAIGQAAPAFNEDSSLMKRGFDCSNPPFGLSQDDCRHMSNMGMAGVGNNARGNNGGIWIGDDGATKVTFTNRAATDVTVIVWNQPPGDFQSSFMNVRRPQISYSLHDGQSVTVSIANGVSGGWAGLYNRQTPLSQFGQISNTWGEFTTGGWATVDVSREVNMRGQGMTINTPNCVSNMDRCVFVCKNGDSCGAGGSYNLQNCANGSQGGATFGLFGGNPSGGCQGFSNGGRLSVSMDR